MKLTGVSALVYGRKIYEREDGFYQDITGKIFDYRYGKLYEQRTPGKWYLIRPQPEAEPEKEAKRNG